MHNQPPYQVPGPPINRLADVMAHTTRYAFEGMGKLARDAGVSRSTLSKLIHNKRNPSFLILARITTALERALGRPLDPRELIAEYGAFPTPFVCKAVGCGGCLPERAYNEFGDRLEPFVDILPGHWVTSIYPKGFAQKGDR